MRRFLVVLTITDDEIGHDGEKATLLHSEEVVRKYIRKNLKFEAEFR
jgi:hypothetical protein